MTILSMEEKEKIKYLDIVFKDINDFELVSINNPIFDFLNPKTKEEKDKFFIIVDEIKLFARNNDLIEKNGDGGWFKLTENGKKLKKIGGYIEYEKYLEEKESVNNLLNVKNEIIMGDKIQTGDISNNNGNISIGKDIETKTTGDNDLAKKSFHWQKWGIIVGAILTIIAILVSI